MTKSKINKTDKILCIVESPNKKATITSIFKSAGFTDVKVLASVGHITEIEDDKLSYWNTGIFPNENFRINFKVSSAKAKVVAELKEAVKKADIIILATDPDREGECISWHLKEQLKIPGTKCCRITFHEITKSAILAALEEPRKIDNDLVDAAKARSVIDKMIGYRMSPIARTNIGAKSVGRCQSAGLKLIVDREKEIKEFVPKKYYELYLQFKKNKTVFKAKYNGIKGKPAIKKFDKKEDCEKVMKDCEGRPYIIESINRKEIKEYPKAPFTTSTFQQEANKTYGISIDTAMSCAQKLFEGLNIKGEHIGLITYIRTDDATMSPEFITTLEKYVKSKYSSKYLGSVKTVPKSEGAQAGHECLRVVDPEMTPEKLKDYITDNNLLRIYRLIWNRTVSCLMAPAIISDTQYDIVNQKHLFVMHSREMIFDGYRAIYSEAEDDDAEKTDDTLVKEKFIVGELLQNTVLKVEEKETTPPKRYNQASFVKELEKEGIGRPSTFATIINTILAEDRGYCTVEGKNIIPTEKGIKLSDFLEKNFNDIINIKYTSEMEHELDLISQGKLKMLDFLTGFYGNLESIIKDRSEKGDIKDKREPEKARPALTCPVCGAGMVAREGPYGSFWGCVNYPKCKGLRKKYK